MPTDRADGRDDDEDAGEPEPVPEEEVFEARKRGLGSLLGLLDSSARRGQDIVAEVAKGSKEEIVRVISAEVRGFLDKMDIVDLAQEIVSGLKIEARVEIKFSRDEDGTLQPKVTRKETKLLTDDEPAPEPSKGRRADKPGK